MVFMMAHVWWKIFWLRLKIKDLEHAGFIVLKEEIISEEGKEILKDLKLNLNEYEGIAHAVIGYKDQETISKVIKENRAIFLI